MHDVPSEPLMDLEAQSRDEQDKRPIAASDTVDVDLPPDMVRIQRAPRAQGQEREMLRQPWLLD